MTFFTVLIWYLITGLCWYAITYPFSSKPSKTNFLLSCVLFWPLTLTGSIYTAITNKYSGFNLWK